MSTDYISLKEAASLVKESETTIKRLIWSNKIFFRRDGKGKKAKYLVDRTSLFQRCQKVEVNESLNDSEHSGLNIREWQRSLDEKTGQIILLTKQIGDQKLLLQASKEEQEQIKMKLEYEKEKMGMEFDSEKKELVREKYYYLKKVKNRNYVIAFSIILLIVCVGWIMFLLNPSLFDFLFG